MNTKDRPIPRTTCSQNGWPATVAAVRNLFAGIEQNYPWIVTHDNPQRAMIEARFAGILEAFDRARV